MLLLILYAFGELTNQIINLSKIYSPDFFAMNKLFDVYKKKCLEWRVFITGSSHSYYGIDLHEIQLAALNFSGISQDLYYGYKIMNRALSTLKSDGENGMRWIELNPYIFHVDLSISSENYRVISYNNLLRDTHNFPLSSNMLDEIFVEGYFNVIRQFQ